MPVVLRTLRLGHYQNHAIPTTITTTTTPGTTFCFKLSHCIFLSFLLSMSYSQHLSLAPIGSVLQLLCISIGTKYALHTAAYLRSSATSIVPAVQPSQLGPYLIFFSSTQPSSSCPFFLSFLNSSRRTMLTRVTIRDILRLHLLLHIRGSFQDIERVYSSGCTMEPVPLLWHVLSRSSPQLRRPDVPSRSHVLQHL